MRRARSAPGTWRRAMAGIVVIAPAAVAVLVLGADRAAAQGRAWCLIGNDGRSCGCYTFERCLASRAGGASHCAPNPDYPASRPDADRPTRSGPRR